MSDPLQTKLGELFEVYNVRAILAALAELCECEAAVIRRETPRFGAEAAKYEAAAGVIEDASGEVEV